MDFLDYKLVYREEDFERLLECKVLPDSRAQDVVGLFDIASNIDTYEMINILYKRCVLTTWVNGRRFDEIFWVEYNYSHKFEEIFEEMR